MRIALVALEGSLLSALAGLEDLFWMTGNALHGRGNQTLAQPEPGPAPVFETLIVGADGRPLRDPRGRQIHVDCAFDRAPACDAALVTGMALGPDGTPPATEAVHQAADWLAGVHRQGTPVGAACAGTFVLGEAGLLDGRRCTTTWWLHHAFQRRFPAARPVWGTALQDDGGVITTGGPLSWIDLALHMIRHLAGAEAARQAADIAVTDSQPLPQLPYAPRGYINASDPLLLQAEQLVRHASPGLTAEELARALHLSNRTLHRRLRALCNESPKAFITRVRIETACMLLETPGASIKQIALQCGYGEESAFRRAFVQLIGMTPADYRRRAEGRAIPAPRHRG